MGPTRPSRSVSIASLTSRAHMIPATLAFLQQTKRAPASGSVQLLFPLPGTAFIYMPYSASHHLTCCMLSLVTLFAVRLPNRHCQLPELTGIPVRLFTAVFPVCRLARCPEE